MEKTASAVSLPNLNRAPSRHSVRSRSSRMKKVAAPPPPILKLPIANGRASRDTTPSTITTTTPGEDCAIDELLEGSMDVNVILPDGSKTKMTVDRRMAMMDLLIQVATTNKISPAGHMISIHSKEEKSIHYKPNTPIGSLDTNTVYVISKPSTDLPVKKMPKLANQPFEQQTFRLQVNLPRNQRMVLRVNPCCTLAEVKQQICSEKELSHSNHHLVHPAHPETVLDLNSTLEVYGCAEISLMSNSGLRDSIRSTSTNFFTYQRPDEEKKRKGILGLFSRRKKGVSLDCSTNGVNGRGVSPSRSEISIRSCAQPKQSTKRKPAPAPPPVLPQSSSTSLIQKSSAIYTQVNSEASFKPEEVGSTVSHSRHSSDSSGYHEPSVFSDCSENKSPDASVVHSNSVLPVPESPHQKDTREVLTSRRKSSTPVKESANLQSIPSCSNVSIISTLKKRKAPQPPALLPTVESPNSELPKELVVETTTKPPTEGVMVPSDKTVEHIVEENIPITSNKTILLSVPVDSDAIEHADDLAISSSSSHASPNPSIPFILSANDTSNLEATTAIPVEDSKVDSFPVVTNPTALPVSKSLPMSPATHTGSEQDSSLSDGTTSNTDSCTSGRDTGQNVQKRNEVKVGTGEPSSHANVVENDVAVNVENGTAAKVEDGITTSVEEGTTTKVEDAMFTKVEDCATAKVEENTVDKIMNNVDKGCENSIYDTFSEVEATMAVLDIVINEQMDAEQEIEVDFAQTSDSASNSGIVEQELAMKGSNLIVPDNQSSGFCPEDFTEEKGMYGSTSKKNMHKICLSQSEKLIASTENSPSTRRKLENFELGCYKSFVQDIYSSQDSGNPELILGISEPQGLNNADKDNSKQMVNELPTDLQTINNVPLKCKRNVPDVKIVAFSERCNDGLELHKLTVKGQVQQKRAQWANSATLPSNSKSLSLYNLPPRAVKREINASNCTEELNENPLRTQSDRNLSQDESKFEERETNFIQEQKRLLEEYQKLQAQFLSWQKQLMNNQSLLQNEQIVPELSFPSFEKISSNLQSSHHIVLSEDGQKHTYPFQKSTLHDESTSNPELHETRSLPCSNSLPLSAQGGSPIHETLILHHSASEDNSLSTTNSIFIPDSSEAHGELSIQMRKVMPEVTHHTTSDMHANTEGVVKSSNVPAEDAKSQTLPRPKPKPRPNSALLESGTMTLNRHVRPKSQLVSVTIESWQQRNQKVPEMDMTSVACMRSKFQSFESIPQEQPKSTIFVGSEKTKSVPEPVEARKESGLEVEKVTQDSSINVTATKPENKPKENARHSFKTTEVKMSRMETIAQSRYPKPLIRLSSMKDEVKPPALKACHKWPLGERSGKENSNNTDVFREELKASSKRPTGLGGEKVHRGEVDLRHKSLSKARHQTPPQIPQNSRNVVASSRALTMSSDTTPKAGDMKLNLNASESNETGIQKRSQSPSKFTFPSAVNQKDLHVTTVSISNNVKDAFPMKSPKSPKFFPGLSVDESDSKMKTMAELKSVLAQKTLEREAAAVKAKQNASQELSNDIDDLSKCMKEPEVSVHHTEPVPPPPPPPTSTIPSIPPADPIPISSQLLMGKQPKGSSVKQVSKKFFKERDKDPREELMLEIRGFGGRQALRKIPGKQASWHLKVFGPTPSVNS